MNVPGDAEMQMWQDNLVAKSVECRSGEMDYNLLHLS